MIVIDQPIVPLKIEWVGFRIHIGAILMWLLYISYVRFWANALQLNKREGKLTWFFYKTAVPLIMVYIVFGNLAANFLLGIWEMVFFIVIRVYLGVFGFYVTVLALTRRKNYYYRYLVGGSIAIIVSSLLSTYVYLFLHFF